MWLLIFIFSIFIQPIVFGKSLTSKELAVPIVTVTLSDYNGFNVSCPLASDGSIDLDVTGGISPYTFVWSNGETTEDLSGLTSGSYTVTVTDGNGDITTETYILTEPLPIQSVNTITQNVTCFGLNNGGVDKTFSGGVLPYTFLWSDASSNEDLTNVIAGSYDVTVTDLNGCTVVFSNHSITQPDSIQFQALISIDSCERSIGSIDISVIGGTPSYSFLWSNGEVTEDIINLPAGTYTITLTDANSCIAIDSFIVAGTLNPLILTDSIHTAFCDGGNSGAVYISTGGSAINSYLWSTSDVTEDIVNLIADTYTVTVTDINSCTASTSFIVSGTSNPSVTLDSTQNVLCNGGSNGSLFTTLSSSSLVNTFQWSNGAITEDLTNVVAGTYTLTVTDANGCFDVDSFVVSEPINLALTLNGSNNVSCFSGSNGSIDISVSGGTTTYSFLWSNGATTPNISLLQTGTYTVTVTDANLCTATNSYIITEPAPLSVTLASSTNASCLGSTNGAIDVNISGGTINYSFSWSNGATTQNVSSLQAGTYTVTVTDANLCSTTDSYLITEPAALSVTLSSSTNASCFGGVNGSISISVTGGTTSYSFLWSNGATTQNISSLQAGTYTVTVTDANLCTATQSYSITGPNAFSVSLSNSSNISCFGGANGAIDITPNGGTPGYTYNWSNGATTQDISGVVSGIYSVTITDANLCTLNDTYTLTQPLAPLLLTLAGTNNVSCFGGTNGSIDITPNGGTQGYTYNWSNGATSQDISGVGTGTYTVTVTDANLCTVSNAYSISQPNALSISLVSSTNVSCFGGSNGAINITPNGGINGYTYNWSNGSTSQDLTGLNSGTYTITVTDANLCTTTSSYTLTQPSTLSVSLINSTQVSCFGGNNGAIDITPNGGTVGYTYNWSNGATSQDLTGLNSGIYSVTITDANLCSATSNFSITQPALITISLTSSSSVTCFGGTNGIVNITPTGGTGGYSYNWSNGATTQDLNGVVAGNYSVTVTDANLCSRNSSFNVIQPQIIAISLVNQTDVTCFGGTNGELKINVTGGVGSYNYNWSNGALTQNINSIAAGNYTVTVTDQNICSKSNGYAVAQPPNIQVNVTTQSAACGLFNGSASVNCSGGVGGFNFVWNTGATTSLISNLAPGTYTVTSTDQNACSKTTNVNIAQVAGPDLVIDSIIDVTCFGLANGAIYNSTSGGTPPYTYLWDNLAITEDLINAGAGTYTLVVTDVLLCTDTIVATIVEPAVLAATLSGNASACSQNNGTVNSSITGGTSPYTYVWSNAQTTANISNLAPGTYTVTVTDANLCTTTQSRTVGTLNAPSLVVDSVKNVKCFGQTNGAIYTTTTGGNGPLTYVWSPGGSTVQDLTGIAIGNYTLIVTDSVNCKDTVTASITQPPVLAATLSGSSSACNQNNGTVNSSVTGGTSPYTYVWSNAQTTANISNLAPGTYTVTVTDANLCTTTQSRTVGTLNAPSLVVDSVKNVKCFGQTNGAIYTTTTGGNGPLTYVWSPGGSTVQDLTGIAIGNYTLIVTDSVNCKDTVTAAITQPPVLAATLSGSSSACNQNNGTVNSSVTGGTSPYTYVWSNAQTTSNISNLAPGTYTVTVTDANLCTTTQSRTVGTLNAPSLVVDSVKNVKCFGQTNGAIYTTTTGGNGPLTYVWSPGGSTVQDLTGIAIGNYTLIVTDSVNCKDTVTAAITQPAVLAATLSGSSSACNQNNGTVNSSITGGTSPYTYVWSNAQTTANISNLAPGTYTVTVTDANLCTTTQSRTVGTLNAPSLVVDSVKNVKCFGQTNGAIYTTTTGGNGPLTYVWSPGGSTVQDLTGIAIGNYTLIVTDSVNCKDTVTASITQPPVLAATLSGSSSACNQNNGTVNSSVTGGTSPYTYVWSNAQTTANISNLAPGTYTVTVTDANLCTTTQSRTVGTLNAPSLVVDSVKNVKCFGQTNGAIYTTTTGGNGPLTYVWSPGGSTVQDLTGIAIGNYTLIVTDSVNCKDTVTAVITQPTVLAATLSGSSSACNQNNGTVNSSVTGGTSPYTYVWSNAQTTSNISNLAPGTYTVTVTDANLCTTTQSRTVGTLNAPSLVIDSVKNVKCFGQTNGAIYTTTTGGNGPLTYVWSPGGSTVQDLTGIAIGNYTLIVTDSVNCKDTVTAAITQPTVIAVTLTPAASACGQNNGSVSSSVVGGTGVGTYTYLWSNSQSTASITNLAPATYTVTVTDANLCTKSASAVVGNITGGPVLGVDSIRNVKCFGQATGGAFINSSGAATPFTYLWSNGALTEDIQNVLAGAYTITVTDTNNCSNSVSVTILQPSSAIAATISSTAATCGNLNGTATTVASGGTPGYTYLWNNSATTPSISNLTAGSYTVTVKDANLCSIVKNITVSSTPALSVVVDSMKNVKCFGQGNGAIYTTVTGGLGNITYQWSPVQPNSGDITGLTPGTYTLIVSDTNSCSDTVSTVITQPLQLVVNVATTPERCGLNNGSANAVVSGGTLPYSYLWNTSAITQNITNLTKNTYTVTIADANLCSASASALVDSLGSPVITLDSVVQVKCNGQANGSIYVTVTGGNGTLSYSWSPNGSTQQDLLNVIAGTYTVTVTDTNFCTATQTHTITQPTAIATVMSSTPSTCGATNGTASVDVTGGTQPYSYLWITNAISDSIFNLSSGLYTVTITDTKGCTKIDSVLVDQDGAPNIVVDSIIAVKCNNGSDGAIYTSTSGGVLQYTYQWSSPIGNTTPNNINISAGSYTVTVTDANGCKDSVSVTLNNPAAIQTAFTTNNASCNLNNGTATVNPSGGSGIYSFVWSTSATDTTNTITGLTNATYTVTVTDNNNCSVTSSVNVGRTDATSAVVDSTHNISCNGLSDGAIYITPSGGDGNYTYQWSFGSVTTQDLENVPAGAYTVTVSDGAGCTFTISNDSVTQNPVLFAVASSSPTGCGASTGTATVTASGGTGPGTYTYLWSFNNLTQQTITGLSSGTYTVTVHDANLCSYTTTVNVGTTSGPILTLDSIVPVKCFGDTTGAIFVSLTGGTSPYAYAWSNGKTTQDIINLSAGTYTLTVTDDNTCVAIISATVTQNPLIVPNFNVVSASCGLANGVATTNPTGGTGGYFYIWTGFPGNTTNTLTGSANTYQIRIVDNSGCFIDTSVAITNIGGTTIGLDSIKNLKCVGGADGAIYITVTGGTLPYTYSWQGTSPLQTTQDATNLPQGIYTVIVTDSANCVSTAQYSVDTLFSRINIAFTPTNPTCGFNNGQVIAIPSGGNSVSYSYAWSVPGTTSTISSLGAGSYTVTVTDASNCTQTAIASLSNITGASIVFTDSANVSCFGGSNGFITTSITGGTQPYTVLWQDSVTTPSRTNLTTGNYTIKVTDANGCITVRTIFIDQPTPLLVNAYIPPRNGIYNVTCNGSFDGEIDLTVSGGTPYTFTGLSTYAYQWSISGATSSSVTGIPAGSYNVTITDSLGCANTSSYLLIEPPLLNAGTGGNISICGLDSTIISTLIPTYGIGKWSLLSGTGLIVKADSAVTLVKNLGIGTNIFAWVVKDDFCSDTSLTLVTVKETVFSDAGIDQNICKNSLVLSAVPPQFGSGVWSIYNSSTAIIEDTSAANAPAFNLALGQNIFTWTVRNGNCTDIDTVVIEVLPPDQCLEDIFMPTGFTPNGDGLNDLLVVRGLDDENSKISIFNRWGNLVFEKSNYLNNWDGKSKTNQDLPDGTYYVILSVPSRNTVIKSYIDLRR